MFFSMFCCKMFYMLLFVYLSVKSVQSMEELRDVYQHFLLYYYRKSSNPKLLRIYGTIPLCCMLYMFCLYISGWRVSRAWRNSATSTSTSCSTTARRSRRCALWRRRRSGRKRRVAGKTERIMTMRRTRSSSRQPERAATTSVSAQV